MKSPDFSFLSMSEPLELRDWIAAVGAMNLIMTVEEFATLPEKAPVSIVALEFMLFQLKNRAENMPHVEPGKEYAPKDLFGPCVMAFARVSDIYTKTEEYANDGGDVIHGDVAHVDGTFFYPDDSYIDATLYSARADRHASTGSGDGWTRYMSVAALEDPKLPKIFWKP